jgi:hypothetical protein
MARIRSDEFIDFALKGKNQKINGNLTMKGNDILSYTTKIAEVDRDKKIVRVNDGDFWRSKTTKNHLAAIDLGFKYLWTGSEKWTKELVQRF